MATHCSVAQSSRLIQFSVSTNSDESGKQTLYPDGDPDHHQHLTICSLAHCQPSVKISCKSVRKFLRKVANKQTVRQTDKQRRKHNLTFLGGSNNALVCMCIRLYCSVLLPVWRNVISTVSSRNCSKLIT